ncbi:MAG: MjaI family restriction endonuclease [Thermoplasmata archaeon]|nr:MjaI family restriction endonuclease [Thermoplasmata archaeon]
MNLANQNAQGTRPKVVGQMSELIQAFPGKTLDEWEKWYLERYPDATDAASDRIQDMLNQMKKAMGEIDRELIERWVKDLVIVKTFIGLRFQEAILAKGAEIMGINYCISSPEEESQGIDGYYGEIPVSIKPMTYRAKKALSEKIEAAIIYYEKVKDGIRVDYSEVLNRLH